MLLPPLLAPLECRLRPLSPSSARLVIAAAAAAAAAAANGGAGLPPDAAAELSERLLAPPLRRAAAAVLAAVPDGGGGGGGGSRLEYVGAPGEACPLREAGDMLCELCATLRLCPAQLRAPYAAALSAHVPTLGLAARHASLGLG